MLLVAKLTRYSVQKLLVAKNHSLRVAEVVRCKIHSILAAEVARCKIHSKLVAKIHLLFIALLISIATYYVRSLLTRANSVKFRYGRKNLNEFGSIYSMFYIKKPCADTWQNFGFEIAQGSSHLMFCKQLSRKL